jgi:hypothetical protein
VLSAKFESHCLSLRESGIEKGKGGRRMPTWYVLLDGPPSDLVHVKQLFTASGFTFEEIDGKNALSAPAFEQYRDQSDVIDAGMELLAAINVALRVSVVGYTGFDFHGLVEKRPDGSMHRTMLARGTAFGISGAVAVGVTGSTGKPVRSKEERLVSLLTKRPDITNLAVAMTARPLTWGAMNTIYESAKGLMSTKVSDKAKRGDYQGLIDRGWITQDQSISFYKSAAYHRHGYPKIEMKGVRLMKFHEASSLIKRLFWNMVDAMEPT